MAVALATSFTLPNQDTWTILTNVCVFILM